MKAFSKQLIHFSSLLSFLALFFWVTVTLAASERTLPSGGLICSYRKGQSAEDRIPKSITELRVEVAGTPVGNSIIASYFDGSGKLVAQSESPFFIQYERITTEVPPELHRPNFGNVALLSLYSTQGSNVWVATLKPFRFEVSFASNFVAAFDCLTKP